MFKHLRRRILGSRANTTNSDTLVDLGVRLQNGSDGEQKDVPRAVQLYERAVAANNSTAMFNLASLLDDGADGVERDVKRAVQLYESAVAANDTDAMNNLALLLQNGADGVERDVKRAVQLYERAIAAKHPDAMTNLASLLDEGADGVEKNVKRAVQLYEQAIAADSPDAMFNLALLLQNGADGLEKDMTRAVELYERAVAANNSAAMTNLALLLDDGADGVERDVKRAVQLYERAVAAHHPDAMVNLALLLQNGTDGIERDLTRAIELYERAIDANHPDAMVNLALLVQNKADGVEEDAKCAVELYQRAVTEGSSETTDYPTTSLKSGVINTTPLERPRKSSQHSTTTTDDIDLSTAETPREGISQISNAAPQSSQKHGTAEKTEQRHERNRSNNNLKDVESVRIHEHAENSAPFTVFISHAGPDKHTLAAKIHERLSKLEISAFLDFKELRPGEDAPENMIKAMEEASIFVFIVSPEFSARKWTVKELLCALRRHDEAKQKGERGPLIIPAFYRLDIAGCKSKEFGLTDEWIRLFQKEGTFERMRDDGYSLREIAEAMRRLPAFTGIENREGATNEGEDEGKRERYAQRIVEAIAQVWLA